MKKVFTLLFAAITGIAHAQNCTNAGLEICSPGSTLSTDFRNAIQISGTGQPLSAGAQYKFSNAVPGLHLDAVITINAIVNATIKGNIDDDNAANETGVAASQASLFVPHIVPDEVLSCSNRSGYVEFTLQFYTHYNGNAAPVNGTEIALANINFLNFDIDGITIGANGAFKETSAIKTVGPDPANHTFNNSELTQTGNTNGWMLTYGSTINRTGIANCAEVAQKSVFFNPVSAITFRLGYEYTAPVNCTSVNIQPVADYGIRLSCFKLPAAGPLPVSLVNLSADYAPEKANIS